MAEVKKINGYTLNDETSRANIGCNADTYSNARTYNVGDVVVYNKQIHKCKAAVTTPEAFDSEKWQQICLRDLVIGLKDELADRTETFPLKLLPAYETDNGFTGNVIFRKFGKVVTAYFSGTIKAGDLAFIKLDGELPKEFWPLQDILIKAQVYETDKFSFYINADGTATSANTGNVYNDGTSDVNVRAVATYIVDSASSGSQDIQVSEEFIEETLAAIEILEQENTDQQKKIDALMKDYDKKEVSGESIHINDSLEYDMPISINGGIEQETREGYQLIDVSSGSLLDTSAYGVNSSRNEDVITLNGTANTTTGFLTELDYSDLVSGETYRFSIEKISGEWTKGAIGFRLYNSSNKQLYASQQAYNETNAKQELSFTGDIAKVQLYFTSAFVGSNFTFKVLLTKGIDVKPYEKFGAMPSLPFPSEVKGVSGHYDNVVSNKNIWNGVIERGSLTSGQNDTNYSASRSASYTKINSNSNYAFSVNGKLNRVVVSLYDKDKNFISNDGSNGINASNGLFTTYANAEYLRYRSYNDDATLFETGKIQIEENTVATEYVEHQEQLLPIDIPFNMYSGKPYKENGKWYRDVEFEKIKLTSNMNWVNQTFNDVLRVNTTDFANIVKKTSPKVYSNCFKQAWEKVFGTLVAGYINFYTNNALYITTPFTTIGEWKAYLDENEVYVVFDLETPYAEEITDTTLIAQLEELQKAHSYYEVTNINSYGSEDTAPLVLSGEYIRSNKIRIENLEKAILSLGGNV